MQPGTAEDSSLAGELFNESAERQQSEIKSSMDEALQLAMDRDIVTANTIMVVPGTPEWGFGSNPTVTGEGVVASGIGTTTPTSLVAADTSGGYTNVNVDNKQDHYKAEKELFPEIQATGPALDETYTPVPTEPFRLFDLPLSLHYMVLESYLQSLGTTGSRHACDCFKVGKFSWRYRALTPDDLCYNLHNEFGYHAKFLPLLCTNRQMHDEFRFLRYAHGTFHIIPVNSVRLDTLKDRESPFNRDRDWPWWTKLDANPDLTHITPFPESASNRDKKRVKAPLLQFQKVPAEIWNEINVVNLTMEFGYYEDWKIVRRELEGLVGMLLKRTKPLKKLSVKMGWGRVGGEYSSYYGFEGKDSGHIWTEMLEPLSRVDWGKRGARVVLFRGRDWWDGDADPDAGEEENGEQRTFRCDNFKDFAAGLEGAMKDDRLEVVPWYCGC